MRSVQEKGKHNGRWWPWEVRFLENYVKVILYAYPSLKTVGKDYEEHIRNRAVLSYVGNVTAEKLAEYIAGEIIEMDKLEALKEAVDGVLAKLTDGERALLGVRYFGKRKSARDFLKVCDKKGEKAVLWSERKYFRYQQRLGEKVGGMLRLAGITKRFYEETLADLELMSKIERFVEAGRDCCLSARERSLLQTAN